MAGVWLAYKRKNTRNHQMCTIKHMVLQSSWNGNLSKLEKKQGVLFHRNKNKCKEHVMGTKQYNADVCHRLNISKM